MEYQRNTGLSRRTFIGQTMTVCLSLAVPLLARAAFVKTRPLSVGLITDLHHDVMHDGLSRMQAFIATSRKSNPDALLQLGDFAYPADKNKEIIDLFNQSHPNKFHVIGNHDTDGGYTHKQCVEVWGMPAAYYTSVVNGFRFIFLNGNEKGSPDHKGGYPAYIGPEQTAWLKQQLAAATEPVIIVSHQPLVGYLAVDNATEIQQIITAASHRVVMAINGHTHVDSLQYVKEIPYLTINSASYFWVGQNFMHDSYSPEIHKQYPWISRTCPYKDPLFTMLTIDPKTYTITLKANKSEWVGKSPEELGFNEQQPLRPGEEIVPFIRSYKLSEKRRMQS
ncbi:metallophosphoesterase family protein [Chitinophaga arvensicola]|uniref:Calcineurin-like phosphoesterase n=1 Tax=Chitinophaga arvensicola TaxID=29529 RepID=A0A1I0S9E7_9BACT|nr:metallophosphoesterase [Chitinophaga arvensicola]SEW52749.1 Calcineurin-like phosphoesterase [Chitinophaga arvensicola]